MEKLNNNSIQDLITALKKIPDNSIITFDGYEQGEEWVLKIKDFESKDGYILDNISKEIFIKLFENNPQVLDKCPHLTIIGPDKSILFSSYDHFDYIETRLS